MKRFLNKRSKTLALLVLVCSMSSSCTNDFFELTPNDRTTVNIMFKTADDFNLAVIGCYSKLQGQVSFFTEFSEYRGDNLYISAPTAGTQDRYDIDQFRENPSNGLLENAWANYNNGVYRCNMVLDRIDAADFEETKKNQYKGEALFIRAFTYFNMYRLWGGVPTTRTVVSLADALTIKRSTDEEMFDLITSDLHQIIDEELLPAQYTGDNVGRATSGAAIALLGKVYLTFHKWEEARNVLSQVIGKYSLCANPIDVFDVNNKMNQEIIFAIRFNKSVPGEGHGFWHSVANLNSNNAQTDALKNSYENNDARKELISYVQAPGESNVFVVKKFLDSRDPTTNNVGNDFILLRYADVLLMYAEALNKVSFDNSENSPAMIALNEVVLRAKLNKIQSNDDRVKDQTSFNETIMIERQREFPYEGHRWFDLVRMGGAKKALEAEGHSIADYQLLFPIPTTVLERVNDNSLIWQNPGYQSNF